MSQEKLSIEKANQIGGSIQRLVELGDTVILSPGTEVEVRALRKYLADELPKHANELLASWFVLHTEYQPLCHSFAALLRRAVAVNEAKAEQQQSPPQEEK